MADQLQTQLDARYAEADGMQGVIDEMNERWEAIQQQISSTSDIDKAEKLAGQS